MTISIVQNNYSISTLLTDSGRGTSVGNSRPNSQIEDNKIIRSESVGKRPTVIHEQVGKQEGMNLNGFFVITHNYYWITID